MPRTVGSCGSGIVESCVEWLDHPVMRAWGMWYERRGPMDRILERQRSNVRRLLDFRSLPTRRTSVVLPREHRDTYPLRVVLDAQCTACLKLALDSIEI